MKQCFIKLGDRIKKIREEKNLSLLELSEMTGIKKKYLERIEMGTATGMKLSHVELLCNALNITPDVLF